jgi:hypothetical protein
MADRTGEDVVGCVFDIAILDCGSIRIVIGGRPERFTMASLYDAGRGIAQPPADRHRGVR